MGFVGFFANSFDLFKITTAILMITMYIYVFCIIMYEYLSIYKLTFFRFGILSKFWRFLSLFVIKIILLIDSNFGWDYKILKTTNFKS